MLITWATRWVGYRRDRRIPQCELETISANQIQRSPCNTR